MTTKRRILCLTTCYLPGYKFGGPLRTIVNMVEHLSDDFDILIVTSDRDLGDTEAYPDVQVGAWNQVGKAKVFYLAPGQRTVRMFAKLLRETEYDVLYLNSFFDPVFTLKPLIARRLGMAPSKPCVLATRGEFTDGHLKLKSLKKSVYLAVVPATGLFDGITWQASSQYEVRDIGRRLGGHALNIREAMDLPPFVPASDAPGHSRVRTQGTPLKICFLSRIHPMKNLDFALGVLRTVSVPVEFNIYGPIGDEVYWAKCQASIALLPSHVTAHYRGPVTPEQVPQAMAANDLFFFPSLGENYGHVIAEALSEGTPVLLSDTTPWRNLEGIGVGWDLPLDAPGEFAKRIEDFASLDENAQATYRHNVKAYARKRLTDPAVIKANKRLFLSAS
jgi:glycosyltransferase involved in cell wall biosynthesis